MNKKLLLIIVIIAFILVLIVYLTFDVSRQLKLKTLSSSSQRGVILIIADALRADHLSCYNYTRTTSPHIDSLAKKGILFTHAYSQSSWTKPSIASIFTSSYPSVHRAGHIKSRYGYSRFLHAGAVTLAEIMKQNNYRTYGVLNNPSISAKFGFDQGFEKFENNEIIPADVPTQETYSKVINYLREIKDDNFLLVWHIIDPHWPYCPPPEFRNFIDGAYRGRFQQCFTTSYAAPLVNGSMGLSDAEIEHIINLYDGEVRYTDYQMGKLLEAIKQMELEQRVTLIFTSDHGESFLEHGHFGHEFPMYEENLRIPLIIFDSRFDAKTISTIVESIDIMPTIMELVDIPVTPELQGQSLLPLLGGTKGGWKDKNAYSEASQFVERKALRTPYYKLIWGVVGVVLNDSFICGQTSPSKFLQQDKKLYNNEGNMRDIKHQLPEKTFDLTKKIRARVKNNEQNQLTDNSIFRSFYFLDDWQESVYSTQGSINWDDGVLKIVDDPQAQAIWKVTLPRPMLRGQLQLMGYCDKSIPFFAISKDQKKWYEVYWQKKVEQRFATIKFNLSAFTGSQTLYLKLFQPSPAHTYLKHFYIHAQFSSPIEVDERTLQNLKSLGYLE